MIKNTILLFIILVSINISTSSQIIHNVQNKDINFKEIRPPYKSISPIVNNLLSADYNSLDLKVQSIWRDAENNGLPYIEKDSLYSDYVWLTFFYKDSISNRSIKFEIFGIYSEFRFGDMQMHRLENTDLYYRSYMVPNDICFSYRFQIEDTITKESFKTTDIYNSNLIPSGSLKSYSYSVVDLSPAKINWYSQKYENINSTLDTLKYTDNIVKINRNIYIYLPPDYDNDREKPYPVVYLFDAFIYLNRVEVPNIMDNLITEGKIEPMIAVLFGTYRESRKVLLPLNFDFMDEFVTIVYPMINENYNTSLNPKENTIGGMSYGGLAAAFIAFHHPDLFGKVLSQSGSFWRDQNLTDIHGNEIRSDWMINKILISEKKEIDFYLDWGLQENMVLGSNRKMVRVLNTKGYNVKHTEFNGWHDWSNSRKTFTDGLLYLTQ